MVKIKLRTLFFLIVFIAVSLGVMRQASRPMVTGVLYSTYTILVVASVGAATRRNRRESWTGFAICGWAYFTPLFIVQGRLLADHMPTTQLLALYASRSIAMPAPPKGFLLIVDKDDWPKLTYVNNGSDPAANTLDRLIKTYNERIGNAISIGHCCLTIIVAFLGSLLGRVFHFQSAARCGPATLD